MVKLRLTRKFAEILNGIDLSGVKAGEEIDLSEHEAHLLLAEGWASPLDQADDKPPRARRKRKNRGLER